MSKSNSFIISSSKYSKIVLLVFDVLIINIAFGLAQYILLDKFEIIKDYNIFSLVVFSNLIWILLIGVFNAYKIMRIEPMEKILSRSIKMIFSQVSILFLVVYILEMKSISKLVVIIYSFLFVFFSTTFKILYLTWLKNLRSRGLNNKRVIIIGDERNGKDLEFVLKKEISFGYKVLGFITTKYENIKDENVIGHIDDIYSIISSYQVDEIFFTLNEYQEIKNKELIIYCERNFIRFKIVPNFKQFTLNRHVNIDFYNDIPILILRKEPLENLFNQMLKRTFDLVFSFFVIICFVPWLFPIVILIQKITSKGPVYFKQLRSGQDNKIFGCLKFRTMEVNELSDSIGTQENDPRITKFGKILRKTRIDELPQFFNVFVGHMSVVGPRPHMLAHTEEYSELINEFMVRHFVKPGITGWAQTVGYIDESRKLQEMKDKVKNDIWYIENWSFLLDLKIIFNTVFNTIKGDKNAK